MEDVYTNISALVEAMPIFNKRRLGRTPDQKILSANFGGLSLCLRLAVSAAVAHEWDKLVIFLNNCGHADTLGKPQAVLLSVNTIYNNTVMRAPIYIGSTILTIMGQKGFLTAHHYNTWKGYCGSQGKPDIGDYGTIIRKHMFVT